MLEEFKKSIQSVLYERISSPFSGAFVLSWFVWNWKLIYYIITVDSKIQFGERILFIESNYINWQQTLGYPILSAAFFVILYPFVTTGAMYIWLRHKKWQNEIRNKIENMQLLSLEKSIALRLEMKSQGDRFESLISKKEDEINLLKAENEKLRSPNNSNAVLDKDEQDYDTNTNISNDTENLLKILNHKLAQTNLKKLIKLIHDGIVLKPKFSPDIITFFEVNNIIEHEGNTAYHRFTEKGKRLIQEYYNQNENKIAMEAFKIS